MRFVAFGGSTVDSCCRGRDVSTTQGYVCLSANLPISKGPALPIIVQKNGPMKIEFRAVVDKEVSETVALRGEQRDGRIELDEHVSYRIAST